jgi:hypothetical protein
MRLSKFILSNLESIIAEWVTFARTIPSDKDLEELVLRDHAQEVLETIALDMETAQSDSEHKQCQRLRKSTPIQSLTRSPLSFGNKRYTSCRR